MQYLPSVALSVALAIAASPTLAQPQPVVVEGGMPSATVSYADLDLSSAPGRQTLEGRVARAISGLCVGQGRKSVREQMSERRCTTTASTKARADISQAVVSAELRTASRSSITLAAK